MDQQDLTAATTVTGKWSLNIEHYDWWKWQFSNNKNKILCMLYVPGPWPIGFEGGRFNYHALGISILADNILVV